jgi:RNA polymerase sigma-70 factor (ECF subfamily)
VADLQKRPTEPIPARYVSILNERCVARGSTPFARPRALRPNADSRGRATLSLHLPSKHVAVVESTDADLVARCRTGDVDAFEVLYRRHASRIYALACRMSGSPEAGEDLLQEIFLQAFRKIGSFKGDAAIGTWLYRLALNHCLDFVRSRQSKVGTATQALDGDSAFEPRAPRETPIARIDLERALERLPPGCREAFVLHDVEGYDHKEVAEMLGLAEGTSKSQVFKARMKLRALLLART